MDAAAATLRRVEHSLEVDIAQASLQYQLSAEQLNYREQALDTVLKQLTASKRAVELGAQSQQDLASVIRDYHTAQVRYQDQRLEQMLSYLRLLNTTGELNMQRLEQDLRP